MESVERSDRACGRDQSIVVYGSNLITGRQLTQQHTGRAACGATPRYESTRNALSRMSTLLACSASAARQNSEAGVNLRDVMHAWNICYRGWMECSGVRRDPSMKDRDVAVAGRCSSEYWTDKFAEDMLRAWRGCWRIRPGASCHLWAAVEEKNCSI